MVLRLAGESKRALGTRRECWKRWRRTTGRVVGGSVCASLGMALLVASCNGDSADRPESGSIEGSLVSSDPGMAELVLDLSLGHEESAAPEFHFSSIADVLVLRDGTIWILDGNGTMLGGQAPELRRFDSRGTFLGHVGRSGEGPGEYRAPYALAMTVDGRVALRDYALPERITLYTGDGAVDTTWSLPRGLQWPFGAGNAVKVDTAGVVWLSFLTIDRSEPGSRSSFFFGFDLMEPC